jgi:peptidoglycan/LPS O-acetylase OafA/YrhL
MLSLAQAGTPLEIPSWIHFLLWPALIGWALALGLARRDHPLLRSARLGLGLSFLCFLADGAAMAAAVTWPTPASSSFVFALLWLAVLLSLSAYLVLRAHDDGGGGDSPPDEPEPPWWPEFERQFRDYTGGRPRPSAGNPRAPVGRSS